MADRQRGDEESSLEVLKRIENVILEIVTHLAKDEAPTLVLPNRSSWDNVSFDSAIGLQMSSTSAVRTIRSDCPKTATTFSQILKILSVIYTLVQSNSYATKRDIYYNHPQLFGSQKIVDRIVDDVSCMLKIPRRSLRVAVAVSSNIAGIRNIVSSAKFILVVEKDATFQRLLQDDFCTKLSPLIMITGKGFPDVNSRLMVRKLWDVLNVPVFTLVDADPHGIEIMCIYKYGSVVPRTALIPLTKADENKLNSLLKRPYVTAQPEWLKEMTLMQKNRVKAEIQSLAAIGPDFLTSIYLPNKLRFGGWL